MNLAAQAGVRHAAKNPVAFGRDNAECFTVLMEVIRSFNRFSFDLIKSVVDLLCVSVRSQKHPDGRFAWCLPPPRPSTATRRAPPRPHFQSRKIKPRPKTLPLMCCSEPLEDSRHMYGATKRYDELLASVYHKRYGIAAVT